MFAVLSPTLVVPVLTEMAAERRMYLPLAAAVALAVVGGYAAVSGVISRRSSGLRTAPSRSVSLLLIGMPALLIVIICGVVSANRLAA